MKSWDQGYTFRSYLNKPEMKTPKEVMQKKMCEHRILRESLHLGNDIM
jgi:hypothetical protein